MSLDPRQVETGAASVGVDGSPANVSGMRDREKRGQVPVANLRGLIGSIIYWAIGSIIYWAAVLMVLFGVISAAMSLALFEGGERLQGTLGWIAFTIAAYVVGRVTRVVLLKCRARFHADFRRARRTLHKLCAPRRGLTACNQESA